MPKWKKDTKEFLVGVNYVAERGYSSSIPKPVIERLGNPDSLKFVIKDDDKTIQVCSGTPSVLRSGKVKSKNV